MSSGVTVIPVNRDATEVVRLTPRVKRRIEKDWRRLQADLERNITHSEVIDAAWNQVVYAHLRAALQEGGKS